MAILWKRLYTGRPGLTMETLVPAVTSGTRQLKQVVLVNRSTSSATITLHAVPADGVANEDNVLIPNLTLEPRSVVPISFACFTLDVNDTIQGMQGTTGAVTVHIHGVEG